MDLGESQLGYWRTGVVWTHLDGLRVNVETFLLVDKEVLDAVALVTLELDDVSSLLVVHDGSIASELLCWTLVDFAVVATLNLPS
jgi:hypothetical protein